MFQTWKADIVHFNARIASYFRIILGLEFSTALHPFYRSPVSFGENLYKNYVDFWDYSSRPNVKKQRNAFPPNFIHSIDSSHMMLTAIHSQAAGISFASVHDCFWTHPSTVSVFYVCSFPVP